MNAAVCVSKRVAYSRNAGPNDYPHCRGLASPVRFAQTSYTVRVVCGMSKSAIESLHKHYVLGLLSGSKSVTDMSQRGLLPFSKAYGCRLLAQGYGWHLTALISTLKLGIQEVIKA